jgi:putative hydrolase of the HAD superfamily
MQAVLLDADGVIQTTSEGFLDTLKGLLQDPRSIDGFLRDIYAAELPSLTGDGDFAADLQAVLETWNIRAPVQQALRAWTLIKPIDGVKALTARLRLKGILSCVASNQQSYRADHMSHVLGYWNIFDREFYSCDLGVTKSSPEFFEKVIDALKADPSELLFIDDNAANVDAAISAGLNATMFNARDHLDPAASLSQILSRYGA